MKAAMLLLVMSLLSACVPWVEGYYEVHSAQGTPVHSSAMASFAKNAMLFQHDGLEILVKVSGNLDLDIRLFVPEGKVFSVKNPTVLTSQDGKNFDHKYTCKFYRMGEEGEHPTEMFVGYPDKYLFHKSGTYYVGYVVAIGHNTEKITVRLPVFETKSHKPIRLSDVSFEHKTTVGITPIND